MLTKVWEEKSALKRAKKARACNLCGRDFITKSSHLCFCEECRSSSDLYRYHDWLPELPAGFSDEEEAGIPRAA
jgi:hypothetical protein